MLGTTGKFAIGVCDLSWSSQEGTSSSASSGSHLSGRLYYPAERPGRGLCGVGQTPHVAWLPRWGYARGFGQFLFGWRKGVKNQVLRNLFEVLAYTMGSLVKIQASLDAGLAATGCKLPVIIFSHGIGGFRNAYSTLLTELASWGFVVLAMEHADGTASAVQLPDGRFKYYGGWPPKEEGRLAQTRYRAQECQNAVGLLRGLSEGAPAPGLKLGSKPKASPMPSFKGRLDLDCCAILGHSFGGATSGLLAAQDPLFHCAICFDPWWPALLPECPTLVAWQTTTPILIMGSQDWNNRDKPEGFFAAGAERQKAILRAAKRARQASPAPRSLPQQQAGASEIPAHPPSFNSQGGFGSPQSVEDQLLGASQPTTAQSDRHAGTVQTGTQLPVPDPSHTFSEAAHPEIAGLVPGLSSVNRQPGRPDAENRSQQVESSSGALSPDSQGGRAAGHLDGADERGQSEAEGSHLGGGAMLLVLAGSSHHSFHDVLALFSTYFKSILRTVGFQSVLEPFQGLRLIRRCMLTFLAQHLPLTPDQHSLLAPFPHPSDPPPKPVRLTTPGAGSQSPAPQRSPHPPAANDPSAASPSPELNPDGGSSEGPHANGEGAGDNGSRAGGQLQPSSREDVGGSPGVAVTAAAGHLQQGRQRLAAHGVQDPDKDLYRQLVGPDAIFILETS